MVATAGSGWRLAPSLIALVAEADRRKPTRSRLSDGSIGDTAHSARTSDHNPADGWVCAVDLDDDGDSTPILGVDLLVNHLVASRDPRVKYVIRNGRIWQPSTGWRTYTGINAHRQHAHISIWNTPAARDDVSAWWPPASPPKPTPAPPAPIEEEEDMAGFELWRDSRNNRLYRVAKTFTQKVPVRSANAKAIDLLKQGNDEIFGATSEALHDWLDSIPTFDPRDYRASE